MGWLIKIALLDDRFYVILLSLFRFGIIRTGNETLSGISLVFGVWKLELQTNLSIVTKRQITLREYGKA